MAITISFGLQKGGAGKTTTSSITSYLLSKDYKVLAVDFDSQGNMTYFLTQQNIYNFEDCSVLEAMKQENAERFIHQITDNLHILPAHDILVTIVSHLYENYRKKNIPYVLKNTLTSVQDDYDFIIIDLPPNLGDQTINGLTASDYTVVVMQSDPFSYDALDRYMDLLLRGVKQRLNPDLYLAGILTTMLDSRTVIDSAILERVREDYDDIVFDSVIKRRSRIKEFANTGISDDTKTDKNALAPYQSFVDELLVTIDNNEPSLNIFTNKDNKEDHGNENQEE